MVGTTAAVACFGQNHADLVSTAVLCTAVVRCFVSVLGKRQKGCSILHCSGASASLTALTGAPAVDVRAHIIYLVYVKRIKHSTVLLYMVAGITGR